MAAMPHKTRLLNCRHCGEPLARVTPAGGVYSLDGVRMAVERLRVSLQCSHCSKWSRWTISKLQAA